ncbi:4'-phosphopantetheinyl transferase superfamily protein [Providencia stuartii]|uniref:4'-phosphopantetheinyl transferase family protein n=2 Tax=Providencia stuartii TaxID=588 RepID=UPI00201E72B6|nr:4'-phosphopantetheinyl transferase superfamily protein [Providencia stuartii]UQZ12943.1 4'-phosphopantetheinyl transferase superfamily protein [Providencia stuartii]
MLFRDIFYLKDHNNDGLTVFIGNFDDYSESETHYLCEQEKLKAFKISNSKAKKRYIASLVFLRRALGIMLKIKYYKGKILKGKFGKPFIKNEKVNIHFNLSHTKDIIAIVFSFFRPVGIDIEKRNRAVSRNISNYVFNNDEIDFILSRENWVDCYLHGWIKKEAILKCIGCGINGDVTNINVPLNNESNIAYGYIESEKEISIWHLIPINYGRYIIGMIAV